MTKETEQGCNLAADVTIVAVNNDLPVSWKCIESLFFKYASPWNVQSSRQMGFRIDIGKWGVKLPEVNDKGIISGLFIGQKIEKFAGRYCDLSFRLEPSFYGFSDSSSLLCAQVFRRRIEAHPESKTGKE
jgi:hypothetical protein